MGGSGSGTRPDVLWMCDRGHHGQGRCTSSELGRHTSGSPPKVRCQQGPADVMWGFGPLLAPSALPWTHGVTREETRWPPMPPEQGGAGRTAALFGLEAASLDIWVSRY